MHDNDNGNINAAAINELAGINDNLATIADLLSTLIASYQMANENRLSEKEACEDVPYIADCILNDAKEHKPMTITFTKRKPPDIKP